MPIVNIYKPTKDSVPRPTREELAEVAEQVWRFANEHAHELEKGNVVDKFYATCIKVASSNLKAMLRLSSPYFSECGSILRNLVETCVDFFWVGSWLEVEPSKGERLCENFFLFGKSQFVEHASLYLSIARNDPFLRGIKTAADDPQILDDCRKATAGRSFGHSWRFEQALFADEREVRWKRRSEIAAQFAKKAVNLKGAPYLSNLTTLSGYSHFDPAQLDLFDEVLQNALFDRSINIAIGFVFDMLMFSNKRNSWQPPQTLVLLQHKFIWFSR